LNVGVIGGYGLLALSMLLTMFAYKKLPLSMSPAFESFSYIFVTVFGVTVFHERVTKKKLLALGLIIAGILVFTL
jgi:drug/metabolite transporter (DMT)-like permease